MDPKLENLIGKTVARIEPVLVKYPHGYGDHGSDEPMELMMSVTVHFTDGSSLTVYSQAEARLDTQHWANWWVKGPPRKKAPDKAAPRKTAGKSPRKKART